VGGGVAARGELSLAVTSNEGVRTLTLRQPGRGVVVLDWALLRGIDAALDEVEATPGLAGFVLTSDSRVFIGGANLAEIMDLSDADLHEYLRFGQRVFGRIAALGCASVAALNGAALGGGLEIALHCDHVIAAAPAGGAEGKPARAYQVGLPEAGLGICPGWGGTNMLPARIEAGAAIEMTASGRTIGVDEAERLGLVEEIVPAARLLERAREIARRPRGKRRLIPACISEAGRREWAKRALERVLPTLPMTEAAKAVAACVGTGLEKSGEAGWRAALDAERENLVRLRNTAAAREAISKFFEKAGVKSQAGGGAKGSG